MSGEEGNGPDLDKLVADLHPDKINEEVSNKHYGARASYTGRKTKVSGFDKFKKELIAYVKHHHEQTHNGVKLDDAEAYQKALELFSERNPNQEAKFRDLRSAYDAAEGGRLQDVLNDLSEGFRAEHENAYVVNVMHRVDPFDRNVHKKVATKYLDMARQVAPGVDLASVDEIAHDYQRLLGVQRQLLGAVVQPVKKYKGAKTE